jgi:hypothetical protein
LDNCTYDADRSTKGLGGKVGAELGLDDTVSTVGTGNTAPDNTDLAAVDFTLGAVDVSNTLTEIELSINWSLDTLNLDKRSVLVLVALGTLVTQNTALAVKTVTKEKTKSVSEFKQVISIVRVDKYGRFAEVWIRMPVARGSYCNSKE